MGEVSIEQIKELRKKTSAPIGFCREALEKSDGDLKKALDYLRQKGANILEKRAQKESREGIIEAYIHPHKKIGVLLELLCETDFVARNEEFINLAHDLAMQIAATAPSNKKELLSQPFIKDESIKIADLINEKIAKLGENIQIGQFIRYQIG